jgi:hypothetical protein
MMRIRVVEQLADGAGCDRVAAGLMRERRRSIGHDLDYGVLSEDRAPAERGGDLLYDRAGGTMIAFNASYMEIELRADAHENLGLVGVDPGFSEGPVLGPLRPHLLLIRPPKAEAALSTSRVPAVIGKVAESFVTAYRPVSRLEAQLRSPLSRARDCTSIARFGVGRGRLRRGTVRHHQRLHRRVGQSQEDLLRRAEAS